MSKGWRCCTSEQRVKERASKQASRSTSEGAGEPSSEQGSMQWDATLFLLCVVDVDGRCFRRCRGALKRKVRLKTEGRGRGS